MTAVGLVLVLSGCVGVMSTTSSPSAEERPRSAAPSALGVETVPTVFPTLPAPPRPSEPEDSLPCVLEPTLDLEAIHAEEVAASTARMQDDSRSGDNYVYYSLSFAVHGMLSAIESTFDASELDLVVALVDQMLDAAGDFDGDGFYEWTPLDARGGGIQLGTWQMESAITRAAALILATPAFRASHEAAARRWIAFVHADVFERWFVGVYGYEIPYVEWGGGYRYWSDKATHFLTIMTFLYAATGDEAYREVAERGARVFESELHDNGRGGYVWSHDGALVGVGGNEAGVPDTSHGNREPMWMVFAHDAGIVFTSEQLERMGETLASTIWDGSVEEPRFANYIDGGNLPYRGVDPWANGQIYAGWALVGRWSASAELAIEHSLAAILRGVRTPSLDYMNHAYGRVALTGHLLRNTAGCR